MRARSIELPHKLLRPRYKREALHFSLEVEGHHLCSLFLVFPEPTYRNATHHGQQDKQARKGENAEKQPTAYTLACSSRSRRRPELNLTWPDLTCCSRTKSRSWQRMRRQS